MGRVTVTTAGHTATADYTIAATTPPTWVEDWASLDGWTAHGAADLAQFGARTRNNVEVVDGRLRVHVRPTPTTVTIGGQTFPAGSFLAGMYQLSDRPISGGTLRWTARATPGWGGRLVVLTWPAPGSPSWSAGGGEIDAIELNGTDEADRNGYQLSLHWGTKPRPPATKKINVDMTTVHEFTLRWVPRQSVTLDVDGAEVFRDTTPEHAPPGPMFVSVQSAVAQGGSSPTLDGQPRVASYIEVGPVAYWTDPTAP